MIFNGNSTAINLNTQEVTMHHVFVIPLSASHFLSFRRKCTWSLPTGFQKIARHLLLEMLTISKL